MSIDYRDPHHLETLLNELYYQIAADPDRGLQRLQELYLILWNENFSAIAQLLQVAQDVIDEDIFPLTDEFKTWTAELTAAYGWEGAIDYERRMAAFKRLSSLDHLNRWLRNIACFQTAYAAQQIDKYDVAIDFYRQALNLIPNDYVAYNNLGNALQNSGDLPGAITRYEKAIELQPDLADAYYNLGIALQDSGDLPGAIVGFEKAIELQPDYADAYYNLGLALKDSGDLPGAIAGFEKAIELQPDDAVAYNNLGIALAKSGDLTGAIAGYEKAIELQPDLAAAYDNLGIAYQKSGEFQKAKEMHQKAIDIDPEDDSPYYNLGCIAALNNNLTEALAHLEKCLALGHKDFDWIEQDSDWDNIRDTAGFKALIAKYRPT